ncbi:dynamin family protein [Helicobacter sp. 11S02629-2]|uniref:dynamin family protein n=1 Tax=Helicobacter sp. 11S02629-2 TaxID=1476195 RepID=UPI000BA4EE49|nr:dynamin family protein [Helicobacter sp. 11S02629-2]PAF44910.1 hypothetical protein BKH40_04275 [Helicobacter sp. 11S02629-2]
MGDKKYITRLEKLEGLIARFNSILGSYSSQKLKEHNLSSAIKLSTDLSLISDSQRLMRIGIVGRVKAGKSSLLNALFFEGESILPKAATPMTAALTTLGYGEEFGVEVEFFTKQDIDDIHKKAKEYDELLLRDITREIENLKLSNVHKNKKPEELKALATTKAQRALSDSIEAACKDQSDRIKTSSINVEGLESKNIKLDNLQELQESLFDFVGSSGKYMPFTKSVNIKFRLDSLKDVLVIDTPGLNDPVASREQRTKEELGKCDVVFIVSPSGQFLNKQDMDLTDTIMFKDGTKEVYVIASQADTQLFGNIGEDAHFVFPEALASLKKDLSEQMHSIFTQLKQERKGDLIGDTTFDKLIKSSSDGIFLTSGICASLVKKLGTNDMSEGEKHVFNNLKEHYPDYFPESEITTTRSNLEKLASLKNISKTLEDIKTNKQAVLEHKSEEFIKTKSKVVDEYISDILKYVIDRERDIKETNLEDLEKQQTQLEAIVTESSKAVNSTFNEALRDLKVDIVSELNSRIKSYFRSANSDINNAYEEKEETKTREREVQVEQEGCLGGVKRFFGGLFDQDDWGYDTKTVRENYTVTTTVLRAGIISNSLSDLVDEVEKGISSAGAEVIRKFKKDLISNIVGALRESIKEQGGREDIISIPKLRSAIKEVTSKLDYPEISPKQIPPRQSGSLTGSAATSFMNEAYDFVSSLQENIKVDIKNYSISLVTTLEKNDFGNSLFTQLNSDIKKLKEDIKNKAQILEELAEIKTSIEDIKNI